MKGSKHLDLRTHVVFQAARTPWLSANQLGGRVNLALAEAQSVCRSLVDAGLLQAALSNQPGYPTARYAPTEQGLIELSNELSLSPSTLMRRLRLTPARFWALRTCMPLVQELASVCCASTCNLAASTKNAGHAQFETADWELFIPRRHQTAGLFLHGQIHFYTAHQVFPFFLLLDRGMSSVWQWYGHLRYLNVWAKRSNPLVPFPTLLIVSTREFRAQAMLALSAMAGQDLPVAVTGDRDAVLNHGVLPLQSHLVRWKTLDTHGVVTPVNPFTGSGLDQNVFQHSTFDIPSLKTLTHGALSKTHQIDGSIFDPPPALDGLLELEKLEDAAYKLLIFLSRNPVAPLSCIATFSGVPFTQAQVQLDALASLGFADQVPTTLAESIWSATDRAIHLLHAREMQTAGAMKRYGFFRADHERRLTHTLSAYRFFENLKKQCDGRSRARRKLDTLPGTINDGRIPYYELAVFESELMASDWYVMGGGTRYWRPDGYGALRAGVTWTRFWIEIDGTTQAPSRKDPAVWDGKLGRLCDYIVSQRWALRYPDIPRLLIITTDLRNQPLIHDALVEAARARSIEPPCVLVADAATVKQRGAGGRIWQAVTETGLDDDTPVYAFDRWND